MHHLLTLTLESLRSDLTGTGITPGLLNELGLEPMSFSPLCPHPGVDPLREDGPGLPARTLVTGQPHHSGPALRESLQRETAAVFCCGPGGGDALMPAVSVPTVPSPVHRVPAPLRAFESIRNRCAWHVIDGQPHESPPPTTCVVVGVALSVAVAVTGNVPGLTPSCPACGAPVAVRAALLSVPVRATWRSRGGRSSASFTGHSSRWSRRQGMSSRFPFSSDRCALPAAARASPEHHLLPGRLPLLQHQQRLGVQCVRTHHTHRRHCPVRLLCVCVSGCL